MSLTYSTGEEVRAGDRVLYHSESGRVEFVADRANPETAWYVEKFGGGCMILTPSFGLVFVSKAEDDLEFVARAPSSNE